MVEIEQNVFGFQRDKTISFGISRLKILTDKFETISICTMP